MGDINGAAVHFQEAIKAATERGVVLPDVYYGQLQGIARQLSFSIAGVAKFDQLQAVKDSLAKAIASGQTFAQWQKQQAVQALSLPKYRLDNIFRTNIQSQYMAGHWEQFERNKAYRPYLMYDAINDSRTRPTHLAMDGIIRPIDDSFWKTHSPPCGYRCRCHLISLTKEQALARSKDSKGLNMPIDEQKMQPDKDWDYSPRERLQGIEQAVAKRQEKSGAIVEALNSIIQPIVINPEQAVNDYLKLYDFKNISDKLINKDLANYLNLTQSEHAMIHVYTANGFVDINCLLYGLEPFKENDAPLLKDVSEVLSQALSKLKTYSGLVIRQVSLPKEMLANYQVGNDVTHLAFTSATFGKDDIFVGESVRMKIFSKTGRRIEKFSTHEDEKEVIFDKGTRFKVKDREEKLLNGRKIIEITLEEI
jgi:SPP1 gp7 family putative phage head morphogenesis protein